MAYTIIIRKKAAKALAKAPQHIRKKFETELAKAALNPRMNKALSGLSNTHRIRAGDWRLIYEVIDSELVITIVTVGPRGDVYKN